MTQIDQAWGSGPSARYEDLAAPFRPLFRSIRDTAVARDLERRLPYDEIKALRAAGFTTVRVPEQFGGPGATLPELFNLLIELSEADSNVTNSLRSHFGFTEDVLNSPDPKRRELWLRRIGEKTLFGNGHSEVGDNKLQAFSTTVSNKDGQLVLNGRKYYTTGTLFADWINIAAQHESGDPVGVVVSRHSSGVEVLDDWDGFGQALTASGTTIFKDVPVEGNQVIPVTERFKYSNAFYQLVHLATLAGIGRAATNDVARLVKQRTRVFSHGNASSVASDPQILQVVGRVRGNAYAAGAIVLKVAEALQRAHEAQLSRDEERTAGAVAIAEIELDQAVTVVSTLILEATTIFFDALGASSAARNLALDRYWRNARTIANHNPRVYRDRIVGDFAVNGTLPPGQYRIGTP
ncbi:MULTISPECIES: acyl-CoA dehydrogenase family protein [Bradyrhizobium]|uniref:acyl-CoA dehydrogenase family protein n=1 Tax=Bradyrhizobium TaxID=374 RepID=UPI00047F755C|nr:MULTISPECIES: acyl-CoA dehydrogenase family protein [Bradyrhizobium]MCS3566714.1 alkylation response protein AidB-like acyl-CoA dehydrogenase [Bradyrhizobium elkanii]MCW2152560.1 alkylation response protein AidB-like acyl-CoA dehydrogenase [Bradyrhizobium elkanii]MCW2357562.1 alkylation response protein AidB-like acyl-CoA dehydrogenase [Bradyrhizobium elkanii]MCW2376292.1 alkylation response protein AidB-like acyl-CoA dehydrogenase [Bradyrhizobium elkanii]MDI2054720.1 acyl-CoA dehydrogenase